MGSAFRPESAKIYQFPQKRQSASTGLRKEAFPVDQSSPRTCNVATGAAWYHEAAIQEAERSRKQ